MLGSSVFSIKGDGRLGGWGGWPQTRGRSRGDRRLRNMRPTPRVSVLTLERLSRRPAWRAASDVRLSDDSTQGAVWSMASYAV
jgi:hypothetical protein